MISIAVLYYWLDNRYKINKEINTLPYNFEPDKIKKHYVKFYYGDSLSYHWRFKESLGFKLHMYFLDSEITINHMPELDKPYIVTSKRDKLSVWKTVNELCFEAKTEEVNQRKKDCKY